MTYIAERDVATQAAVRPGPQAPARPFPDLEAARPLPSLGGACATSSGAVVVTEPAANRLRWVMPEGTELAIGGAPGWLDGPPATARFRRPLGLAASPDGSVVVADTDNHAIRRVRPNGEVTTLAGGAYGAADGAGQQAKFRHPQAVAVAPDGSVVVADTVSNTVRWVGTDGRVTTLAGSSYDDGDVEAGLALFRRPEGVAVGADGTVYVADTGNDRVCSISPSGQLRVVAGRRRPSLPAGTVYVTDAAYGLVHRIEPDGRATVLPHERGWQPVGLALLPSGEVLVAETNWAPNGPRGRLRVVPSGVAG